MENAWKALPAWLVGSLEGLWPHLPAAMGALAILIGSWLAALLTRRLVFRVLERANWDDRLLQKLGYQDVSPSQVERGVAKLSYYLVLTLGLVALLEYLGLDEVTKPLVTALQGVTGAAPSLLQAGIIALVGYTLARIVSGGTRRLLAKTRLVERIEGYTWTDSEDALGHAERLRDGIAQTAFWVVLFIVSIPVLAALRVSILAEPLSRIIESVSVYVPRALGAGVLLLLGWALGRATRSVVRGAVKGLGVERWLRAMGLGTGERTRSLPEATGTLAMAFVFLHFSISAVGQLGIEEISEPLGLVLDQIYGYLPRLVIAGLLMVAALLVSRVVTRISARVAQTLGVDVLMQQLGIAKPRARVSAPPRPAEGGSVVEPAAAFEGQRMPETPSELVGAVLGAVVLLLFARQVLLTLELDSLAGALAGFIAFMPHVMAAAVIVAFGVWASNWVKLRVDGLTRESGDALLRALGPLARVAVGVLTLMVALEQLGVGGRSVALAFSVTFGAVALGVALAFGLGGRGVAARILERRYERLERASKVVPAPVKNLEHE